MHRAGMKLPHEGTLLTMPPIPTAVLLPQGHHSRLCHGRGLLGVPPIPHRVLCAQQHGSIPPPEHSLPPRLGTEGREVVFTQPET